MTAKQGFTMLQYSRDGQLFVIIVIILLAIIDIMSFCKINNNRNQQ